MNVIDTLLQMEIPAPETKPYKIKRLSQKSGQDVVFTLKEIGFSRVAEIQKAPRGKDDEDMTSIHIVLAGVVEPDLKDARLLEKYKAVTPAELVKKMLRPGEIEDLSRAIERLSGYRVATIEEVKKK